MNFAASNSFCAQDCTTLFVGDLMFDRSAPDAVEQVQRELEENFRKWGRWIERHDPFCHVEMRMVNHSQKRFMRLGLYIYIHTHRIPLFRICCLMKKVISIWIDGIYMICKHQTYGDIDGYS